MDHFHPFSRSCSGFPSPKTMIGSRVQQFPIVQTPPWSRPRREERYRATGAAESHGGRLWHQRGHGRVTYSDRRWFSWGNT